MLSRKPRSQRRKRKEWTREAGRLSPRRALDNWLNRSLFISVLSFQSDWRWLFDQDILRLLFGKDVKDVDVDVDMIIKKRNELIADRGKKARAFYTTLYQNSVWHCLRLKLWPLWFSHVVNTVLVNKSFFCYESSKVPLWKVRYSIHPQQKTKYVCQYWSSCVLNVRTLSAVDGWDVQPPGEAEMAHGCCLSEQPWLVYTSIQ